MLVKIDELKKLLTSNQITSSQYEIELKNIKDHIAVYHTIL